MTVSHSKILSLARSGSPGQAWALFLANGWNQKFDDPKILTLKGRLLKDQAKAAEGADRIRLYGEAANAYTAAAVIRTDSYPLINAATLALLGGEVKQSENLAQKTLELIDADPKEGENDFWRDATRSEALLLLGRVADSKVALLSAMRHLPRAWEDHAATLGQFELILSQQGRDLRWLDQLRPPASIYFSGLIGLDEGDQKITSAIEHFLGQENPGFGFGALAAGADILIAEALNNAGVSLRITLPFPADRFRELSVQPFGRHWESRYDALIEAAETVDILPEILGAPERSMNDAVDLANMVTMGQSIRNAGVLKSTAKAITIRGIGEEPRRQFHRWSNSGREFLVIETERTAQKKGSKKIIPKDSVSQIYALLWIKNVEHQMLLDRWGDQVEFQSVAGGHFCVLTNLIEAIDISKALAHEFSSVRMSLIVDTMNEHSPDQSILNQASDMVGASNGATLLTDYKSAMAVTLLDANVSIQEIGELKTAYGFISLWNIA